MAIEGPLRELGIHDVFQLLDLSRKTGRLRVSSALRDNEGTVYFANGRVTSAAIRSNPHPLGELLLKAGKIGEGDLERARVVQAERGATRRLGEILVGFGAITPRELERQVRLQIEAVIFELMSWQEGFFSFEEGDVADVPSDAVASISTESLLMEGARRIDEWARIAHKIPHLGLVPILAPIDNEHPSLLDLLPNEWEMLAMIDGVADLRGIATRLSRSEFDVARIAYGLLSTGVIEVRSRERQLTADSLAGDDLAPHLERARRALAAGQTEDALAAASAAVTAAPMSGEARLAIARALAANGRDADAVEELRRGAELEPANAAIQLALGLAVVRSTALDCGIAAWQRALLEAGESPASARVRDLLDCATRLRTLLAEFADA
jgi:hypothetical protein